MFEMMAGRSPFQAPVEEYQEYSEVLYCINKIICVYFINLGFSLPSYFGKANPYSTKFKCACSKCIKGLNFKLLLKYSKLYLNTYFLKGFLNKDQNERLGCKPDLEEGLSDIKANTFFKNSIDWELVCILFFQS
jgi:hypothetical protein